MDSPLNHARTKAITDFLQTLETRSDGRIKGEVFHSGQLYNDADVVKALVQGQVEMAAPGTWILTTVIPDADFLNLPTLYGRDIDVIHRAIDGKSGQNLNAQIAKRIKSEVIGGWLDLGFFNWYTAKRPLTSLESLNGAKIRNSGGVGQAWRAKFVGAIPNTTALPNVPLALSQGTFDGISTTNETVASMKLWDAGIRFALEDHQFLGVYVPVLSNAFAEKLSDADRQLFKTVWAEKIGQYRADMAAAQTTAHQTLIKNGVSIVTPTAAESDAARAKMVEHEDEVATALKISPDFLKLVMADIHGK
ncbi:TRAP transporter substrate-binding protein DctP [Bradyrhizobium sp. NAS80.1]|uniref:TRAP transporter substrate-binding protein DctP n=1 Tax=Bradyrhizobium sp. NAS80.1 TaxID=1680159 RepID=UPI00143CCF7A|nr:TRAP transporter substrate-binding protein DctP [Bradyrhizobium sp. NAS80.1]